LPLKPMLGCIGVAPARKEAISTSAPGAWGGNMDYASMGAGARLMLPVNEPGALLILVLGSARPLLEAFQHATTELQKWLQADYGFTERGAQTFMGQASEYEIANVVDPNFTVVAKIPKALLPRR